MPRGKILPAPAFKFVTKPPVPTDAFRKDLSPARNSPYREALKRAWAERSIIETEKRAYSAFRHHAKKLGWLLHYAEHGDKLLVQVVDTEPRQTSAKPTLTRKAS